MQLKQLSVFVQVAAVESTDSSLQFVSSPKQQWAGKWPSGTAKALSGGEQQWAGQQRASSATKEGGGLAEGSRSKQGSSRRARRASADSSNLGRLMLSGLHSAARTAVKSTCNHADSSGLSQLMLSELSSAPRTAPKSTGSRPPLREATNASHTATAERTHIHAPRSPMAIVASGAAIFGAGGSPNTQQRTPQHPTGSAVATPITVPGGWAGLMGWADSPSRGDVPGSGQASAVSRGFPLRGGKWESGSSSLLGTWDADSGCDSSV